MLLHTDRSFYSAQIVRGLFSVGGDNNYKNNERL